MLTVTQMLREHGVVGKFVEFYGPGVPNLPLADRATIGNMSPEFGSTCAMFPIDDETLRYLEFSGRDRSASRSSRRTRASRACGTTPSSEEPTYSETLELDLGDVVPSLAGPKRPQDRVSLTESKATFRMALDGFLPETTRVTRPSRRRSRPPIRPRRGEHKTPHEHRPRSRAGTGGVQVADRGRSARRSRSPTAPRPSSTTATS